MMAPFTDDPTQSPTVVFPNPGMQALSSVIHLFGVSALGYCFARRTSFPDLTWSQIWSAITWPRLCVILVLADSWVFVFLSGVLILGSGLSKDQTNCSLGIFACIALYAGCKMLTYAFLMEKVHIVWGGTHQPRLKSPVYRICLITMTPYVIIVMLMLLGRIAYIRPDGACIIGLKRLSQVTLSLSLLTYDLYINVFLTAMFIWPLARSKLVNPRLKAVATRTLVAAFAALTTSTLNIAILTVMHGQQLGWVCLGSCGTDVTVNAIVLFWVTSSTSSGLTYSGPQPTTEATTAIGHDPNQGRASPNPSRPNIRSPSAVMLSPVPRSPLTPNTPNPNLNEKSPDAGLLSPSAWKNRFSVSLGKNKVPSGGAEQRGEDVEMSPAPSPSLSPRREVWDDRETTSFVTVNSRDLEEGRSGAGFVTIGAPPASKKRASTRTRVVNGVEVSQQSRSSVLGRIFGTSGTESRERDMEVTVTITTQLDHMDGGSCTSLGMTSVGGGGNTICGKSEGGSIHRDVGAEKART